MFEIPAALSARGHKVHGVACSYRRRPEARAISAENETVATWDSVNGLFLNPAGALRHFRYLQEIVRKFRPDIVWAGSDAWHAFVVGKVCRAVGVPYVIDLYDNYESFALSRLPGMRRMLRDSCRRAAGLTVVTSALADFVRDQYRATAVPRRVIGNAVNLNRFRRMPRHEARARLDLPADAVLIGTAGALEVGRDIGCLFEAVKLLRRERPLLRLVIAGPRDSSVARYHADHVIDLGILPPERVAEVYSALDVGVVCNRDSAFGRYCYPQKYHEMLACGLPVVAADVGEMSRILDATPEVLFAPGSATGLALAINQAIASSRPTPPAATWTDRAIELEKFLLHLRASQI